MIVFPNAKINLGLNILRKLPTGYHEIKTVMVPTDWCDILEVVPAEGEVTSLHTSGNAVDCPPQSNLVMKAYNALNQVAPLPPVDIYLRKIIPDGAGLGGGSADASFVLTLLNNMFQLELPLNELEQIAALLGADCPFFVANKPAVASGIGTTLQPVEVPQLAGHTLLIVKPDVKISTARAYAGVTPHIPEYDILDVIAQPIEQWRDLLHNDFEDSIATEFPAIEQMKRVLYDEGAVYASMSGSGSAVYGIFNDVKMAESAKQRFAGLQSHIGKVQG